MIKSFFLVILLVFVSVFANVTPNPLVEIIEEHRVIGPSETVLPVVVVPVHEAGSEFPPHLALSPQFRPHPAQKPPSEIRS